MIMILTKYRGKGWCGKDMWNVRYVLDGPLWVSVRVFLVSDDVLRMRMTAVKWKTAVV